MGTSKVTKTNKKKNDDIRAYDNFRSFKKIQFSNASKKDQDEQSQKQQSKSKSKSYDLNSYTWQNEYDPTDINANQLNPVQKMILTEFQPDFVFQWGGVADAAISGLSKFAGSALTTEIIKNGVKKLGTQYAKDIQKQYKSSPQKVIGEPLTFIKQLFVGEYLNTYEVPFFNDTYLKVDSSSNWSAGGSQQAIGNQLSSILKDSMSMNFPTTPTWQLSDTGSKEAFSVEFYLINNSTQSLFNNFKFLNAIISGAFWVQMDYLQKSPNVYDIEVPGRFHIYFAALGVEISHVGKLRTNKDVIKYLTNLHSISDSTLWPDAYKMTLTVTDLSPNNFNNYIDYLMNGKDSQVKIGNITKQKKYITDLGKGTGKNLQKSLKLKK